MPVVGTRQETTHMGESYRKNALYPYAQQFVETAENILRENAVDIFEEPKKLYRRKGANEAMRNFFVEGAYDANDTTKDSYEFEDLKEQANAQFDNDVEAMYEHAAPAEYNPIVGMALPIHKLILMNNVFDKGGIQKVTAQSPKFTISLERRILVKPDGTEIDMFTEQNLMTAAIDSANPVTTYDITLPYKESDQTGANAIVTKLGGTTNSDLDISTYISAVKLTGVTIEVGDIVPDSDGYINKDGTVATAALTDQTVWVRTDIKFAPNYGGPNHLERVCMQPLTLTYKTTTTVDQVSTVSTVTKKAIIAGSMNNNLFNIVDINGVVTAVRLTTKLDSSSAMLETCSTKWKVDTDLVEIGPAVPINTTISPEEVKDLSALYNVNQLTKQMELFKTALGNYKDDKIKTGLDDSYKRMDSTTSFSDTFDFAPRDEYALSHVEWRQATFMDFLDDLATKMLQVLNDPNMTVTVFGDPRIIRKITPKEYSYAAPANIGPVSLDYTQTICNISDKRVYNFIGSDKMRNTNQLMIVLNPRNSERICYRIYDYQLYVSNEVRNYTNPTLPAIHAFERWKLVDYQPVQARVTIENPSGLKTV